MKMRESFYRSDSEVARESRELSADLYNRTHLLLRQSPEPCLFVPIRSMQYLAVIDTEEVIFVDSNHRPFIELAWRDFRPQTRSGLSSPVPFEVVYYMEKGLTTMYRLIGEFDRATRLLSERMPRDPEGGVVELGHPTR